MRKIVYQIVVKSKYRDIAPFFLRKHLCSACVDAGFAKKERERRVGQSEGRIA
jgi:hypothetical protein